MTQGWGSTSLRALRILAVACSGFIFLSTMTAYGLYHRLEGNIGHTDDDNTLKKTHGKTVNYLIIGSDSRQVKGGAKYGAVTEKLADTVILAHLPGDGKSAQFVSFPRDGLVTIPSCKRSDGSRSTEHVDKFNAAFAIGDAPCVVRTVKAMTGIEIDDFIVLSLPGFVKISNALGGVEICLPRAVYDKDAKLDLPAGRQKVKGEDALAYVRERKVLGGSRIRRQQAFMASAIKAATSSRLLFNPFRMYNLLDVTTKAITTGQLDLDGLKKLAERFRGVKPGKVSFYTVPTLPPKRQYLPGYGNPDGVYVDPIDTTTASVLFDAIRANKPVPAPKSARKIPKLVVPPANVQVRVLNGTGIKGAAGAAAEELRTAGFNVVGTGDADNDAYTQTIVRYGPERVQSSQTLAAAVPDSVRRADDGLTTVVEIVIGSNYHGAHSVSVSTDTSDSGPKSIEAVSGDSDPCSADDGNVGPA